jgi:mono/diheme cytochrome c family protein
MNMGIQTGRVRIAGLTAATLRIALLMAACAAPSVAQSPGPQAAPLPPGVTAEQLAGGDALYHGLTCFVCHGADAKGGSLGPDLTDANWLWSDGTVTSIAKIISEGVASPKEYRSPMPANGGATLSASDAQSIAAWVWSQGHK